MKPIRFFVSLLFISTLSFSATAADLINLETFPKWFKDGVARDTKVKKTSKLKIEKYNIDTKVKGKIKLISDSDGTMYFTIDIGTGSPVECYVFSDFDGPATTLYSIVEYSLTNVEALNKKSLSGKSNFAIDSGVIGSTPYLLFDVLYLLGEGDEKISGILKSLSAETDQSLQLCMHNEMGYRDAFLTVFESFVQAFQENENNPNFFEVVYQLSINGAAMGYVQEHYAKDADGDVSISNESAMLLPVDSSSVMRRDTVANSWSRPDGSVINASEYSIENGVMSSDFSLAYADDAWQVEGQLQGKPVKTTLAHTDWLLSGFGSYVELKNLRQSESESGQFNMWAPSADPTSALPVVLKKLSDNENANFQIDMGPQVMAFLADEKAIFRKGTIAQGPVELKLELIYSKGEPSLQ